MAAGQMAVQLRKAGYAGEVTIFEDEPEFPYERPPLSKGYLQGSEERSSIFVRPESWYADNSVTVRTGTRVEKISPQQQTVTLADGTQVGYDQLVLATGSTPRTLPLKGADLEGVYSLRTVADADALADQLRGGGKNLVLIGSGWIGMEVAATARTLGNSVTILERGDVPLVAALGPDLGKRFQAMHESHGVKFVMGANVEGIEGKVRADGVRVNGEVIPADLVLIGVGATPNVSLAEDAGIAVDNGVLVDGSMETSVPGIYAIGDIANVDHPLAGRRIRTEHWETARATGKAAALAVAGEEVPFDAIPYFYTDQYGLGMELSGWPHLMGDADIVFRGSPDATETGEYVVFWVKDGQVVAGMNVNIWDVNQQVQDLIHSGAVVDLQRLQDPEVPLPDLLPTD